MKTLTIDRKKWLRGEGGENSYLLRGTDGKMCCLGFFALECGLSTDQILNERSPDEVAPEGLPREFAALFDEDESLCSPTCCKLMRINDAVMTTKTKRESQISALFAEIGWKVEFKGK